MAQSKINLLSCTSRDQSHWAKVKMSARAGSSKRLYGTIHFPALFSFLTLSDFPNGSVVKNPPAKEGDAGSAPGSGRYPGGGIANDSSILAWKIPWTEAAGGLQPVGSQRVRQDWAHTSFLDSRLLLTPNSFLLLSPLSSCLLQKNPCDYTGLT